MEQWYFHAPGRGRVGPMDAQAMRDAFRMREIDRDTLVWRAGLPEWQPLVRVLDELGLEGVQQEAHRPPPLPPPSAARPAPPPAASPRVTPRVTAPSSAAAGTPPSSALGRTGCLIALAVAGVVGLIAFAILAAIALPAYKQYQERARAAEAARNPAGVFDTDRLERVHEDTDALITNALATMPPEDGCPDDYHFESVLVRQPGLAGDEQGWSTLVPVRARDGVCAYDATFRGLGPALLEGTIRYEGERGPGGVRVRCIGINLPPEVIPEACRQ